MSSQDKRIGWVRVLTSEWTAIAVVSLALWASLRDPNANKHALNSYPPLSPTAPLSSPPPSNKPPTTNTYPNHKPSVSSLNTPKMAPKVQRSLLNSLRPQHLPKPVLFTKWKNSTLAEVLPGVLVVSEDQIVARGSIQQTAAQVWSKFAVLPGVLPRDTVTEILKTLHHGVHHDQFKGSDKGPQTAVILDSEPDSVDGMASQEIFLDNDSLRQGKPSKSDPGEDMAGRASLRNYLRQLTDPVLDQIITPFVRANYPNLCNTPGRLCTPCYSLIRRYRTGERVSHAPHHDKHSLVTVVVSLSDYNVDYTGGLYVATDTSQRRYVALNRGDAVVHQGDLYHGVQLTQETPQTERWSWILWYRDSDTCQDHSDEWYRSCAEDEMNPACQYLMATAVQDIDDVVYWNQRAADQGHGASCVKLARAYLKLLHSNLALEPDKAMALYQKAIDSVDEPDGHYGLAAMKSIMLHHDYLAVKKDGGDFKPNHPLLVEIIRHLENAARLLHPFAMFNLGVVHSYGYGDPNGVPDPQLGAEWYEASGLPEGYAARAEYEKSMGRLQEAEYFRNRASLLGYGSQYRVQAREVTGYGGAGGVSLNMYWPPLSNGQVPPKW